MRYWLVFALMFPISATAGNICNFTTECFENEACQKTAFALEFRPATDGSGAMEIVTDAETIVISVGGNARVAHLAGMTASGFHVLTLTRETGAARYTNHISDGPLTVTYLGSCEVGP